MDNSANISLKEVLKELCSESVWKYAVFWRLNGGTHPYLKWEDGHLENINDYNVPLYSDYERNANMEEIFIHMPYIGEGILSEVANTGNHQWIFANEYLNYQLLNYSEDWKIQFLAGINTILFVPILNIGVVQLGSLHMVFEDSKLVTQIKDLFSMLYQISDAQSHDFFNKTNSSEQLPISPDNFAHFTFMSNSQSPSTNDIHLQSFNPSNTNLQFSPQFCSLESQNGVENSTLNPSNEILEFKDDGLSKHERKNKTCGVQIRKRKSGRTDVTKCRPRDRQLIQDRIKELRELVPSGSKCSIDVLLEKTVKQIIFLESVSTQAKKLKNQSNFDTSTRIQEGKIGNNFPLIVEDLDQSGHILIEMICKEYDVFLEMAHIIKNLQLNIIEGNLHSKPDELWARFVIEVSKGFHKPQILWPLMQLLQHNSQF